MRSGHIRGAHQQVATANDDNQPAPHDTLTSVVANGREFTTPAAMHLVVEDGRIVRMHLYEDTLTVDEAFNAG